MANVISLTATPTVLNPVPSSLGGATSNLAATVTDSITGNGVAGVQVTFSSTAPYTSLSPQTAVTDSSGRATSRLIYPGSAAPASYNGIAVITITASSGSLRTSTLVNFLDAELRSFTVLNAQTTSTPNSVTLPRFAIVNGAQVVVYLPPDLRNGDIITFIWSLADNLLVERAYQQGESAWVININEVFIPEQALSVGMYGLWYMIQDTSGNRVGSSFLEVQINDSPYDNVTLPAPSIPSAYYGTINAALAQAGFDVILPFASQTVITGFAQYTLWFRLFSRDGRPLNSPVSLSTALVPDPRVNTPVPVHNPSLFAGIDNAFGDFYYQVVYSDNGTVRTLTSQSARMVIDTVSPGGN